jgi:hypothetical protein
MTHQQTATRRPRRMAREPVDGAGQTAPVAPVSTASKPRSKTALLAEMLSRESGATLDQMVDATGWQPHTTRAALTGLRKTGRGVTSEKADGLRVYRLAKVTEPV